MTRSRCRQEESDRAGFLLGSLVPAQPKLPHTMYPLSQLFLPGLNSHYSFLFSTFLKLPELSNGEPTRKLPQGVVYGVVRRSDPNEQKEMVVYGWSTNQLKEEMNYIRDVSHLRIAVFGFVCTPFVACETMQLEALT